MKHFRLFHMAAIPGKLNNRLVVGFLEILRMIQKVLRRSYSHELHNSCECHHHTGVIQKAGGYIEDQHHYEDMRFGHSDMGYSGCEIIALYNALNRLQPKTKPSLSSLIREFEKDGMLLFGLFGTSPYALDRYLRKSGFLTVFSTSSKELNAIARSSRAMILTMYNDYRDITEQVHTICITHDGSVYHAHNVYGNGRVLGPADSVNELLSRIQGGKARAICAIGIR